MAKQTGSSGCSKVISTSCVHLAPGDGAQAWEGSLKPRGESTTIPQQSSSREGKVQRDED